MGSLERTTASTPADAKSASADNHVRRLSPDSRTLKVAALVAHLHIHGETPRVAARILTLIGVLAPDRGQHARCNNDLRTCRPLPRERLIVDIQEVNPCPPILTK